MSTLCHSKSLFFTSDRAEGEVNWRMWVQCLRRAWGGLFSSQPRVSALLFVAVSSWEGGQMNRVGKRKYWWAERVSFKSRFLRAFDSKSWLENSSANSLFYRVWILVRFGVFTFNLILAYKWLSIYFKDIFFGMFDDLK